MTKKSDSSIKSGAKHTLEVVATDAGVPTRSAAVTLRLDTFNPVLHVVSINMSITEAEAFSMVELMEERFAATLQGDYPTAVVQVWMIDVWYTTTVVSARRRLLQSR